MDPLTKKSFSFKKNWHIIESEVTLMSAYPSGNPQKNPMRWFIVLFGLFWTGMAVFIISSAMEVSGMVTWPVLFFPLFGVFFVGFALKSALRGRKTERNSSSSPMTEIPKNEEDPFAQFDAKTREDKSTMIFCPQCGRHVDLTDIYCSQCGTRIR
jgi:hypothetical protein